MVHQLKEGVVNRRLTQLLAVQLIAGFVFAVPVPVRADDHLASPSAVATRLAEAASARQADLSTLNDFLVSPTGQQAAQIVGTDVAGLQPRLAQLSDAEARDLANRARALTMDPAAGRLSGAAITWIIIGGVALLVLLAVAIAVGADDGTCYGCYY